MKTMFLVPGSSDLYGALYAIVKKAAKAKGALIGVDLERALLLHSKGVVGRVVVVAGARVQNQKITAIDVYKMLKARGVETQLVDDWDWGVEGQAFLTYGQVEQTIADLC
jgi:hypothetical protein